MSIYKMNRQQIVKFCELYKANMCLWKSDSHEYRDRACRANALQRICDEMNIEGFGPIHVAQKIKNLRTTYAQEMRKVRAGTSENVYKPKIVWFKIFDSFLRKYIWYKPTGIVSNVEVKCEVEADPETTVTFPDQQVQLCANNDIVTNAIEQLEKITKKTHEMEKNINLVAHSDEYDCFGSFIASSLKNLPAEYAMTAQAEIMQVLLREKRNALMLPVYNS